MKTFPCKKKEKKRKQQYEHVILKHGGKQETTRNAKKLEVISSGENSLVVGRE